MRKLIAGLTVVVALGLVVSVHGQDLNTLLTYFIQDMRNGTLGTTVTFTSLGLASGGAGTAKDTTLTATAAGKVSLTGTTPMIQLGGTTSSFPAIKQNGARVDIKLADDSGFGTIAFSQATITGSLAGASGAVWVSSTAPTISSGFGTSASIASNNGTAAFTVNVGTGGTATTGVIGLPTATTGWNCWVRDLTAEAAHTADRKTVQTASSTTTASIENQIVSTGATAGAPWAASDILRVSCFAY